MKPRPIHKGHTQQVARGAGSINAEADMQRLLREGREKEAAELYDLHHRIRGASRMRWGHAWMAQYRAEHG